MEAAHLIYIPQRIARTRKYSLRQYRQLTGKYSTFKTILWRKNVSHGKIVCSSKSIIEVNVYSLLMSPKTQAVCLESDLGIWNHLEAWMPNFVPSERSKGLGAPPCCMCPKIKINGNERYNTLTTISENIQWINEFDNYLKCSLLRWKLLFLLQSTSDTWSPNCSCRYTFHSWKDE